ncbi:hypothetical protein C3V37_05255 [Peptostreptococcaceae bacterium oral taxon 929]|nr:hypothetical protein C3V37_05255 [Peptostreptococcaceae bacterium oral taxon 929]OFK81498.1 hypothetical protein HMPREF2800_07490 [Anaerosphaera sp. HMSC064C01]
MIFTFDIENQENYLSMFRLLVSKVMAEENYKFDEIEDTKVAVGEMALIAHAINKDRLKMDIKLKEKSMIITIYLDKYPEEEAFEMNFDIINALSEAMLKQDDRIEIIRTRP